MIKEVLNIISLYTLPLIVVIIPLYAIFKKVPVYETFISGAKDGFKVGVMIIPYLVAILVAIGMFRASGAIDLLSAWLSPILNKIGMPAELLPLAIIRPLSGSGALGIMTEIASTHGADAFITKMAAVMVGCSETTFYVLTVYFGSVGISKFRHALYADLISDFASIVFAIIISNIAFS
ncbi:MAG: spore maturation protein [Candidatus Gastranaerophilales bacterium]|nr:spore maturation protein [Candidatus Gastranaerophilales bacterium]